MEGSVGVSQPVALFDRLQRDPLIRGMQSQLEDMAGLDLTIEALGATLSEEPVVVRGTLEGLQHWGGRLGAATRAAVRAWNACAKLNYCDAAVAHGEHTLGNGNACAVGTYPTSAGKAVVDLPARGVSVGGLHFAFTEARKQYNVHEDHALTTDIHLTCTVKRDWYGKSCYSY
ncbi:hypothetical protein CYMTET_51113 [Cymbomonas tetramitiformis]|uniref:Uncharacterized protein n=1 Tax=Cymbomonas tetramitiformis TaxID=36881 RepID=A0AAE0BMZ9_9CHLO|nr:hypothetical protein CYMTET_51113 [Cymbomonas tetramitiformis]